MATAFTTYWDESQVRPHPEPLVRLKELTFSAARSLKRDTLRQQQREPGVGLLTELAKIEADRLDGRMFPTLDEGVFAGDFDRALRALPSEERDAYILTELRGLSQAEAGAVLGLSQPTVSRLRDAARTAIREEIA